MFVPFFCRRLLRVLPVKGSCDEAGGKGSLVIAFGQTETRVSGSLHARCRAAPSAARSQEATSCESLLALHFASYTLA